MPPTKTRLQEPQTHRAPYPPASHLLLGATGTLHPLIWLSSVSEISICRGSLGAQTVTVNWEVKCWWVKFTIVSTLLFISFPFTNTESQWLDTCGEGVES